MSLDMMMSEDGLEETPLRESGLKDLVLLRKLWPFIQPHRKALLISLLPPPYPGGNGAALYREACHRRPHP